MMMKKAVCVFLVLIFTAAGLLLCGCQTRHLIPEEVLQLPTHAQVYTAYNLWYKDYLDGEGKNYTYSTTNFVVTKDISKSTQIYAGVDNIFDKTFSDDDDYSIYGRTWRTGVTFKF